jgi:hypothetical protein
VIFFGRLEKLGLQGRWTILFVIYVLIFVSFYWGFAPSFDVLLIFFWTFRFGCVKRITLFSLSAQRSCCISGFGIYPYPIRGK